MIERISKRHMDCGDWLQDKQKKDLFWEKNEAKETEMSLEWFSRLHKWLNHLLSRREIYFLTLYI